MNGFLDTANICAVRDNLAKIAVTIDENTYGDGKKPIERLLGIPQRGKP